MKMKYIAGTPILIFFTLMGAVRAGIGHKLKGEPFIQEDRKARSRYQNKQKSNTSNRKIQRNGKFRPHCQVSSVPWVVDQNPMYVL